MPVMGGKGTAAAKVGNDKKKATAAKEKKAQGWSETLSDEPKKNDDDSSKKKKPALVRAKTQSLKFLRVRRKPWYSHERVREAYMNPWVQWFIASLIMGNFISNCVEKQIDPWGIEYPIEWMWIEFAWNSAFVIELLWNMWGSFYICQWKDHFLRSGWNLFDMFVVAVSIPSMLPAIGVSTSNLPGAFEQLRMLRAFRVFRLIKRVKSLNRIITSLGNALPGIINAGFVMVIVMCIYAILAIDLFGKFGRDGQYVNIKGENMSLITGRGMNYGDVRRATAAASSLFPLEQSPESLPFSSLLPNRAPSLSSHAPLTCVSPSSLSFSLRPPSVRVAQEYYGTFARSLFSLFQVLTGEAWAETVARPVIFADYSEPGAMFDPI